MLLLHLAAAPSVLAVYATATACGIALVQLGDAGPSAGLIQCERTLCVAAGRWQCTAAHRLWRLDCPRQQCWSLTCVLGPQQTAAVATAAACCCLIQSSQRCSEACRIRAVWYLLRLSAFRPGDRSWMVRWSSASSIEPSMAGRRSVRWRAERCTARPKKHGSDDCQLLLVPLLGRRARTRSAPHLTLRSPAMASTPRLSETRGTIQLRSTGSNALSLRRDKTARILHASLHRWLD